ncbi:MAG: hypothetical protein C4526_02985 [Nitrospiraceae bacterium]|nr:MAG: hypothetical protein C4526_02985 [Nitrospiraceae bacterium]
MKKYSSIIFVFLLLFPFTIKAQEGVRQTKKPAPTERSELRFVIYVISGGRKPGGSFSSVNEAFTPPRP